MEAEIHPRGRKIDVENQVENKCVIKSCRDMQEDASRCEPNGPGWGPSL